MSTSAEEASATELAFRLQYEKLVPWHYEGSVAGPTLSVLFIYLFILMCFLTVNSYRRVLEEILCTSK